MLHVTFAPVDWREIEARLRPFLARRLAATDVDDVLQDVAVRIQRGLAGIRDDQRFTAWLFQVARSAIAEHGRARVRHPLPAVAEPPEAADDRDHADHGDDDREAARALAACVAPFVAHLPEPQRHALTLVELEGLTIREAADLAGISVSGMKSRVQRGRSQLRRAMEDCCQIALDARGKVIEVTPRPAPACCPSRE